MNRRGVIRGVLRSYRTAAIYVGTALRTPSNQQIQLALLLAGTLLLSFGLSTGVEAQAAVNYEGTLLAETVAHIFRYMEGTFGGTVMVIAGIGAVIAASVGQYRTSIGMLVVAVGTFITRSIVSTFFGKFVDDATSGY